MRVPIEYLGYTPLPLQKARLPEPFVAAPYRCFRWLVQFAGRFMFKDGWTGEELKARASCRFPIPEEQYAIQWREDRLPRNDPRRLRPPTGLAAVNVKLRTDGLLSWPSPESAPISVLCSDGLRWVETEAEARTLWSEERPKIEALRLREMAARERYEKMRDALRSDLANGHIATFLLTPKTGSLVRYAPQFWQSEEADTLFREIADPLSVRAIGQRPTNPPTHVVFSSTEVADTLSPKSEPAAPPVPVVESSADRAKAAKSAATTPVPRATLEKWFLQRVANWPANSAMPSEQADWEAAKQELGFGVPRSMLRQVVLALAPAGWRKPGHRRRI